MLRTIGIGIVALGAIALAPSRVEAQGSDGKLRIIAFGAHPDDAEYKAGGVGALWAKAGHHVKFVSVTNGDIGHFQMAGGPLARRRAQEVKDAARALGIEATEVLDIHDGELVPSLEHRKVIAKLIREWRADVVIGPRPNDYHPDHRYTGVLVNDAAYMVGVPFYTDVPPLKRNPVFLYYSDGFQRPNPFTADIVVPIDQVIDRKIDAALALFSQSVEGGADGNDGLVPKTAADKQKRLEQVRQSHRNRNAGPAEKYRAKLIEQFGEQKGRAVKYAEAFELCEYGRRPSIDELRKLFPM